MAGVLVNLNGITLNLKVEKAVFSLSEDSNSTCQYPDARSRVVKSVEPAIESKVALICGNGKHHGGLLH